MLTTFQLWNRYEQWCNDKTCELIMWLIKWLNCYYLEDRVRDMNSIARLYESAN